MTPLKVVLRNYPYTIIIKDGTVPIEGVACLFPENAPTDPAFLYTIHDLTYDVSETTIVTFLQAREAGHPISLLPIVLHGGFHHRSMKRLAGGNPITPSDFQGNKIGLGSYTQPGGLWVRAILKEEFGIEPSEVTWVATNAPYVNSYVEPPFVERASTSLASLLADGELLGVITTSTTLRADVAEGRSDSPQLVQVIADTATAEAAWFAKHHTIPVNHLLTVQTKVFDEDPAAVRSIYRAFTQAIEQTRSERGNTDTEQVISTGLHDQLMVAVDLAIHYALEQELIRDEISAEQIFSRSPSYLD